VVSLPHPEEWILLPPLVSKKNFPVMEDPFRIFSYLVQDLFRRSAHFGSPQGKVSLAAFPFYLVPPFSTDFSGASHDTSSRGSFSLEPFCRFPFFGNNFSSATGTLPPPLKENRSPRDGGLSLTCKRSWLDLDPDPGGGASFFP